MNQDKDLMSRLDPALIHRVLLTEAVDFPSLASTTQNPSARFSLPFSEFRTCLVGDSLGSMDPDMVMKRAVYDHVTTKLSENSPVLSPVNDLVLQLHQQIRALIPSRTDLHSILSDKEVKDATTLKDIQPLVRKAASSLSQLESENRATTTQDLLNHELVISCDDDDDTTDNAPFWVSVILYLFYKAELCQSDKQDYYLVNVWAPQIHKDGPAFERRQYQQQFGNFHSTDSSAATRQWVKSLVQAHRSANPQAQHDDDEDSHSGTRQSSPASTSLLESVDGRKALIRAGWVQDIIFRGADQKKPLHLPEIFARDQNGLQTLREIARLSVAGCALAFQARSAAGVDSQKVLSDPNCTSKERRLSLMRAMRNRHVPPDSYEEQVTKQVLALAEEWKAKFGSNSTGDETKINQEALAGRVVAVLRGQDPVLKLLDGRTKKAVRDAVLMAAAQESGDSNGMPVLAMRTGRSSSPSSTGPPTHSGDEKPQIAIEEKLFCQRGLAFFSPDLAMVSKLAGKVVNLAIDLYWDDLLDRLVLDACTQQLC